MRIQRVLLSVLAVSLVLVGHGCTTAGKSSQKTAPAASGIPDDVAAHMRAMGQALRSATAMRFTARGLMDQALESGQLVQIERRSRVTLKRPDGLHVETAGDDVDREFWYDGKSITLLDRAARKSATVDVPGTVDELLDFLVEEHGITVPLSDLLYSDSRSVLLENVVSARYAGLHMVGEHSCHHLVFRQDVIDWQLWIDSETPPVPRKILITYKQEPGFPQYAAILSDWDLTPELSETMSAPALTEDVNRVGMEEFLGLTDGKEDSHDGE